MTTKAEKAVKTILTRMQKDPRLAYLIGPCTQTYEDVTDAYAEMIGEDPDKVRAEFERTLKTQKVPPIEE